MIILACGNILCLEAEDEKLFKHFKAFFFFNCEMMIMLFSPSMQH